MHIPEARRQVIQKKFAKKYVEYGGNGTQAALATNPEFTIDSARDAASRWLKRDAVKQEIARALEQVDIDFKYTMTARKEFIETARRQLKGEKKQGEVFVDPSAAHKHLQGMENVFMKLADEGDNITEKESRKQYHLHLHNAPQKELVQKQKELQQWFDGVIKDDSKKTE